MNASNGKMVLHLVIDADGVLTNMLSLLHALLINDNKIYVFGDV